MKVILQSDVKRLGKKGDLIDVAEGYARNYLIPRGLAVIANEGNLKNLKAQRAQEKAKSDREEALAREVAATLEKLQIKIGAKTGESGRLFGSITASDVAEAIKEESGIEVDRRKVRLDEPIKALGTYKITVDVHPGITATVSVDVIGDQGDQG